MQTRTIHNLQLGLLLSATLATSACGSVEPTRGIITPIEKNQVLPLKGDITSGGTTQIEKNQVLPLKGDITSGGTTQIEKNQVLPLKGNITMNPCAKSNCFDM